MSADPTSESRFVRQVLLDPNFRAEGAPVARIGEEVVGFCLSIARQTPLENATPEDDRGYITLFAVAPQVQRRGIGSQLLAHAENYLRSQGRKLCMISPYSPGYFTPGIDVKAYAPAISFFKKHGYLQINRPIAMQIDLWNLAVPLWVQEKRADLESQGIKIEHYCSELTLSLLRFAAEEFKGDWVRFARDGMRNIQLGDSPRRLMIAHRNGQVLGFSHHEAERFGPIGVAATERGRGIGHVLMYQTLRAQQLAGLRIAWFLWSDDATAERIYSAAGFHEVRRFAILKKDL
jgi:ribosomal protein S18 acetylase RimI-like enzyme